MFKRDPVKRIEMTGEARLARSDENLLPWMHERLDVLGYAPEVSAVIDGDELFVRACLSLMPVEAQEPGWADQVLKEAIEWARDDPRLVVP